VYKGIADLACPVPHFWTAARPSANADWLLTVSMSWIVSFITEAQILIMKFQMAVGYLHETHGCAIMRVVSQIWGPLCGYENSCMDLLVIKFRLINLGDLVRMVCVIYQLALHML